MTIGFHPTLPVAPATADEAPPQPAAEATARANSHDEWLLDESLRETFPASDPISPAITPATKGSPNRLPSRSAIEEGSARAVEAKKTAAFVPGRGEV